MLLPLVAMLACSRGTTTPTTTPVANDPPPPIVPDDATVATATPADPTPDPSATKRPTDLAPPTDEEFAAWDRKDPVGDAKLVEWDKAHLGRMLGYWTDLACFRGRVLAEGQLAFGSAAGSPTEERFFQFKRTFVVEVDAWQHALFVSEPRVMEKSRIVGHLLEGHELVMNNYPKAFTHGDAKELEAVEAHWVVVEARTKKYVESLGGTWAAPVCTGTKTKKQKSKKD